MLSRPPWNRKSDVFRLISSWILAHQILSKNFGGGRMCGAVFGTLNFYGNDSLDYNNMLGWNNPVTNTWSDFHFGVSVPFFFVWGGEVVFLVEKLLIPGSYEQLFVDLHGRVPNLYQQRAWLSFVVWSIWCSAMREWIMLIWYAVMSYHVYVVFES